MVFLMLTEVTASLAGQCARGQNGKDYMQRVELALDRLHRLEAVKEDQQAVAKIVDA
jgi:hypothetical protein